MFGMPDLMGTASTVAVLALHEIDVNNFHNVLYTKKLRTTRSGDFYNVNRESTSHEH